ncbi:NAD(P)-dependent oxidoreductase [Aquabacter sp. CN5-332]|uniref:NAD(P)-dependent oxidoreductase n=1 Tax=Aquabacter sp. CN5-332 TaxID=3156608 RepID=UPI0032B53803
MGETPTISWVGLGKMGLPITGRMVEQGLSLSGYDRDQGAISTAAGKGVSPVATLAEAARSDIVFTSLPDDKALAAVAMAEGGLLSAMRRGATLVETSTVSPEISAEVGRAAEGLGIAYLRAPVSGNASIAHTGNLTCFVSGPRAAFDTLLPVFTSYTRAQKYLGEAEEARYAKLSVNLMIAVSAAMMGESIVLGRKGNIGWQDILDVLKDSAVGSPMVHYKAATLATRDFNSSFSCRQMAKDLDLIIGAGQAAEMSMPLASMTRQLYGAVIGRGDGEADFSATVRLSEWMAGLGEPDLGK